MGIIGILITCLVTEILILTIIKGYKLKFVKIFNPVKKVTSKLNNKGIYKFIVLFIGIWVIVGVKSYVDLGSISFGIILGVITSICDLCFE